MISLYVSGFTTSPLAALADASPWDLTGSSELVVTDLMARLDADSFRIADDIAIHRSAVIETGAIVKPPAIIGAACFVAAGAYLRNGETGRASCRERVCTYG